MLFLFMDSYARGNYNSGGDIVLEYGDLLFTFAERDFAERCEQAARSLEFIHERLQQHELDDLVDLTISGDVPHPRSELGLHVHASWSALSGPTERSIIHWLRRLVFRGAWLDQRVKEGELDIKLNTESGKFIYVQHEHPQEPVELADAPSWLTSAYVQHADQR